MSRKSHPSSFVKPDARLTGQRGITAINDFVDFVEKVLQVIALAIIFHQDVGSSFSSSLSTSSIAEKLEIIVIDNFVDGVDKVTQVLALAITCNQEHALIVFFAEPDVRLNRTPLKHRHRRLRQLHQHASR